MRVLSLYSGVEVNLCTILAVLQLSNSFDSDFLILVQADKMLFGLHLSRKAVPRRSDIETADPCQFFTGNWASLYQSL